MKFFLSLSFSLLLTTSLSGAAAASEVEDLKTYCKPDIERLCKGVKFTGGAMKACLKTHEKEISVGCAQALQALKQG